MKWLKKVPKPWFWIRYSFSGFLWTTIFMIFFRFTLDGMLYQSVSSYHFTQRYNHSKILNFSTISLKNVSSDAINQTQLRDVNVSIQLLPEFQHHGEVESSCSDTESFLNNTDFIRADLPTGSFNQSVGNAEMCCRECEKIMKCTQWTFNTLEKSCWLKGNSVAAIIKNGTISGRLSFDLWLERRIVSPMRIRYTCSYSEHDRPFLDPAYFKQSVSNSTNNSSLLFIPGSDSTPT
jgi:hypothetical protein